MINEKEGMIVYERTKLAKPLLIDRLIVILGKYRGKGIGNNNLYKRQQKCRLNLRFNRHYCMIFYS